MGNCGCWPEKEPKRKTGVGNLRYDVSPASLEKCGRILSQMENGEQIQQILKTIGEIKVPPKGSLNGRSLLFMYSDLEPDDTMAIAQLWQRRLETGQLQDVPLIIFPVDFAKKDDGTIFEKKLLVASLMLGHYDYDILAADCDRSKLSASKQAIVDAKDRTIQRICDRIGRTRVGDVIELFVFAPGFGHLGAILERLKKMNKWPPCAEFRVSMYSGQYNMERMTDSDIGALREFVGRGTHPLTDVAKFPFFGGKESHKWTDCLTTFATPDFAKHLSGLAPMLVAALKLINDELNCALVSPFNDSLFKGSTLDDQDKKALSQLQELFKNEGINVYAKRLTDSPLFAKVAGFKKNTVKAFADSGCDSPLCDQLVFLAEYLMEKQPEWLSFSFGAWKLDREKGFTSVEEGPATPHIKGMRPTLSKPKDEPSLQAMREVLEQYLLKHIKSLKPSK